MRAAAHPFELGRAPQSASPSGRSAKLANTKASDHQGSQRLVTRHETGRHLPPERDEGRLSISHLCLLHRVSRPAGPLDRRQWEIEVGRDGLG